jgi:Kef-type K+ transport system membrane component KefB
MQGKALPIQINPPGADMKRSRNPNRAIILLAIIITVIGFHLFPLFAAEPGPDEATPTHEEKSGIGHGETASAGGELAEEEHGGGHGHGMILKVLFAVILILLAAKLGGEVFERMNQPGVIGELLFGVAIGNIGLLLLHYGGSSGYLAGFGNFVEWMKMKEGPIDVLAQIGVVFLLFEVGLETNVKEMMSVGLSSLLVALFGVIVPFGLGWGAGYYFLPNASWLVHMFIGATLTATSVGITARVLKDLKKIQARESKIILGAAVIDDVMGLIILAVAAGIISASAPPKEAGKSPLKHGLAVIAKADYEKVVATKAEGLSVEKAVEKVGAKLEKPSAEDAAKGEISGGISTGSVLWIIAKAFIFLLGSIVIGLYVSPRMFHLASRLRTQGMLLIVSICFCFLLAAIAAAIDLAPIVGAFAAGLILEAVHYRDFTTRGEHDLEELIRPIAIFLVPIFFVIMGMRVDLTTFGQGSVLVFALSLTVVAIIGKQVCSFGVVEKGLDRISVGVGMIPRGEVGLIFADIGMGLFAPLTVAAAGTTYYVVSEAGSIISLPIIDSSTYSAVVIMVIITTLVTPFVLAWTLKRGDRIKAARGNAPEKAGVEIPES